jgi:aerobic carbon-monoxide dehydrogenase medium subunit
MHAFEVRAPSDLGEAIKIRNEYGPDSTVLAGGQSLMILLRQGLVSPRVLLSLKRVSELSSVCPAVADGSGRDFLRIGATVTYRTASTSSEIRNWAPVLARGAGSVGSVHIRNLGTIGGSVCHADPAGDVPTILLVLDAEATVVSSGEVHCHMVSDFFTGMFETRLDDHELLADLLVPRQPATSTFGYRRFIYREGEYPLAVAACRLEWSQDGNCSDARIAVGGGDVHPKRLTPCEKLVMGSRVDDAVLGAMREVTRVALQPVADVRGSFEWKRVVVADLVVRAVADAASRGGAPLGVSHV